MYSMNRCLVSLAFLACYHGFTSSTPEWDQFKVKWGGENCTDSSGYFDMPRTEDEALSRGYKMLSGCSVDEVVSSPWTGKRYVKDNDGGAILIFDVNGYISGIQSAIRISNFPPLSQKNHPFVTSDGVHYITFYFTEPEIICDEGRNQSQFQEIGTGTHLFIQNGANSGKVINVPQRESDLHDTLWVQTTDCVPTMGVHYRLNPRKDMHCEDLFPVFLMYNNGKLDGFGWTIMGNAESAYFDHLAIAPYKTVPDCVKSYSGPWTDLHIFFTSPCKRCM